MRRRTLSCLLPVVLSACSFVNQFDLGHRGQEEGTPEACADGLDNDGDGRVDRDDRGCFEVLPVEVNSCARVEPTAISETFEAESGCEVGTFHGICLDGWSTFGTPAPEVYERLGRAVFDPDGWDPDLCDETCESGIVSTRRLSGPTAGLRLSARIIARSIEGEVAAPVASHVTIGLATQPLRASYNCLWGTDVLGLTVDDAPAVLINGLDARSSEVPFDGQPHEYVAVVDEDGMARLEIDGRVVARSSGPAPSRIDDLVLMVRGNSCLDELVVDEVRVDLPASSPCDAASPILRSDDDDAWEQTGPSFPRVIDTAAGRQLYYSGGTTGYCDGYAVGRAVAPDGQTFRRSPGGAPLLERPGPLENASALSAVWDEEAQRLQGFVTVGLCDEVGNGIGSVVRKAWSDDGSDWSWDDDAGVVLEGRGTGPLAALSPSPEAVWSPAGCELFATLSGDGASRIARAFAPDCATFEIDDEPAIEPGGLYSSDGGSVGCATVVDLEDRRIMLYAGTGGSPPETAIHLATWDPDAATWRKSPWNPVLRGTAGGFDDGVANCPDALYEDGVVHIWYEGRSGIGYARLIVGR